jgi:transposase InsO family protein
LTASFLLADERQAADNLLSLSDQATHLQLGVCMPKSTRPRVALPKEWNRSVQAAMVQVMSLAHYALVYTRSWAANGQSDRARLGAKRDDLETEVALLREEIRIKDARLARIPPFQRPHYQPTERLAILELRAARGWSLAQAARVFQLTAATVASWGKRLDEEGTEALVRMPVPVNKFPECAGYLVQRLQALCPRLGKVKIAQILARAGFHLSATTIGRMRKARTTPPFPGPAKKGQAQRRVTAKYPNHLWHVDLTTVPTSAGFWASWLPFAPPPWWPFCWWLVVILDHYSRRALGCAVFIRQPTSQQMRQFLARVIAKVGTPPRHLVTDQGTQFASAGFRYGCRRRGIRQRFGAIGQYGSIAVIERFFRTLKESIRAMPSVPLLRRSFQQQVSLLLAWYNADPAAHDPERRYAG